MQGLLASLQWFSSDLLSTHESWNCLSKFNQESPAFYDVPPLYYYESLWLEPLIVLLLEDFHYA